MVIEQFDPSHPHVVFMATFPMTLLLILPLHTHTDTHASYPSLGFQPVAPNYLIEAHLILALAHLMPFAVNNAHVNNLTLRENVGG